MMTCAVEMQRSQTREHERFNSVVELRRVDRLVTIRALGARSLANIQSDDPGAISCLLEMGCGPR